MALIIDIETIGQDFSALDEITKKSLTRWIKREAGEDENKYNFMLEDMKEGLGFSPLTGEIVVIGVYDTVKNQGVIYYQSPDTANQEYIDGSFTFKTRTEEEMLRDFWRGLASYDECVSFNGRSFDIPFLMIRSAVYKIRPTKNLLTNKYLNSQNRNARHIDLLDQFSFYGALRRRGNLHLYCRAFNIKSPKGQGITGDDVSRLFQEKKYKEIAEYNSWDLIATAELYEIWKQYINF